MTCDAIIQARMGSKRLPGKVMMEIGGRPMIYYVIAAAKKIEGIRNIVLATTKKSEDDDLAKYAKKMKVIVYRGSENDVLDRYYQVAKKLNSDLVMRLTGDNPLIDPEICNRLITFCVERRYEYARFVPEQVKGIDCEVIKKELIELAWRQAKRADEREHVTLYFLNNESEFTIGRMSLETPQRHYRLGIDYREDFDLVKLIIEQLRSQGGDLSFGKIRALLTEKPDLLSLNAKWLNQRTWRD